MNNTASGDNAVPDYLRSAIVQRGGGAMDTVMCMRVFVAVVENRSFIKAAEELHMSGPAVSRHLAQLEYHLSARLLNRSTRTLSLTEIGETYYDRCRSILVGIYEAEAEASQGKSLARGILRVHSSDSFWLVHLAPIIPTFLKRFPELSMDVTLGGKHPNLIDEGFDVAISVQSCVIQDVVVRRLAQVRAVLCAAPIYLLNANILQSPSDLTHHNCLHLALPGVGNGWILSNAEGKIEINVSGNFHSNNGEVLRQAALAGVGIVALPEYLVDRDIKAGLLNRVLPEYAIEGFSAYASYPSRRHLPSKVRCFIDFLAEYFGEIPPWDR
jgi:DNA-binding transcriptional LysR family regulator